MRMEPPAKGPCLKATALAGPPPPLQQPSPPPLDARCTPADANGGVSILGSRSLFEGASEADVELVCAALRRTTLTRVRLSFVGLSEQSKAALVKAASANPGLQLKFREDE